MVCFSCGDQGIDGAGKVAVQEARTECGDHGLPKHAVEHARRRLVFLPNKTIV